MVPCSVNGIEKLLNLSSANSYLFPRCIRTHFGKALQDASRLFDWPPGLVFSPQCLRHTGHTARLQYASDAVGAALSRTSESTLKHYVTGPTAAMETKAVLFEMMQFQNLVPVVLLIGAPHGSKTYERCSSCYSRLQPAKNGYLK